MLWRRPTWGFSGWTWASQNRQPGSKWRQRERHSDLDAANAMNVARLKLFDFFNRQSKSEA
jgi:hypothetical protein